MKPSVLFILALFAAGCDCASAKVGSAEAAACGIDGPQPCAQTKNFANCGAFQNSDTAVPAVVVVVDAGPLDGGDEEDDDGGPDGGDDGGMP
jgi:hypothetical protein